MKIFLTGSGGMLGKNILAHPESSNYDWFSPTRYQLDLLDNQKVNRYIGDVKPDLIIHAAGKVGGINTHQNQQFSYFYENFEMSKNVIIAAKNHNIPKLINISSGSIYPDRGNNELYEEDLLSGPINKSTEGYSLAKISALKLCQFINSEFEHLNYKSFVACNLFGYWDKFNEKGSMIPSLINRIYNAKNNNKEVHIWGDGTAKRQFLYAKDFSKFLFYGISNYSKLYEVMNVGYHTDYTVREYNGMVARVIGYDLNFKYDLNKPVGNKRKYLNIEKQDLLDFKPDFTMEKAIEETYKHYLSILNE